jgi:hypothetical protein
MPRRNAGKRAAKDPSGAENAWLGATQENTGEMYERPAIAKALGDPVEKVYPHKDDPVVKGYRGQNMSLTDPPGPHDKPDAGGPPD